MTAEQERPAWVPARQRVFTDAQVAEMRAALDEFRSPGAYEPGRWMVSEFNRDPAVVGTGFPSEVSLRDITLRTVEQLGVSLTLDQRLEIIGALAGAGVSEIVTVSIVQGFGFGLVFVPLSTVAFLTLPNHLRTDGTSMLTLMRNVASSIGISIVIAQLTEGGRRVYAVLSEHITPFNHAMQMPDVRRLVDMNSDGGRALADAMVAIQAQIIAFALDYQMVMIITLCAIPLALMIGSSKAALRKQAIAPEHAVLE